MKLYKNKIFTNILSTFVIAFIVSVIIIATFVFKFNIGSKQKEAIIANDITIALFNDNADKLKTNKNADFLPIDNETIKKLENKGTTFYPVYNTFGFTRTKKCPCYSPN